MTFYFVIRPNLMHTLVTSAPLTVVHGEKMQEPSSGKGGLDVIVHYSFFKIAIWFLLGCF